MVGQTLGALGSTPAPQAGPACAIWVGSWGLRLGLPGHTVHLTRWGLTVALPKAFVCTHSWTDMAREANNWLTSFP